MVLPLAMESDDKVKVETMVDVVFDRGYYSSIRVVSTRGGYDSAQRTLADVSGSSGVVHEMDKTGSTHGRVPDFQGLASNGSGYCVQSPQFRIQAALGDDASHDILVSGDILHQPFVVAYVP